MDEFTGLNPTQAVKDISEFELAMDTIATLMQNAGEQLFGVLKNTWYSPKAVEFANKFSNRLYVMTVTSTRKASLEVAHAAVQALNVMSLANGGDGVNLPEPSVPADGDFGELLESGPNGVGIADTVVEAAMNAYKESSKQALELLDSLPTGIALFDQSGQLAEVYSQLINDLRTRIQETTDAVVNDLSSYVESERESIKQGVTNATDVLGGISEFVGDTTL